MRLSIGEDADPALRQAAEVLARSGARDETLLFDDLGALAQRAGLAVAAAERVRAAVLAARAPAMQRCDALVDAGRAQRGALPTGVAAVDGLLGGGGVRLGEVVELVGTGATGKTQVCLHAAVRTAVSEQAGVLYLDVAGGFSGRRVAELGRRLLPSPHGREALLAQQLRSKMRVQKIHDVFALFEALGQVQARKAAQSDQFHTDLQLVVIDGVGAVVAPILGATQVHGHSLAAWLGLVIRATAARAPLAILMTNHAVGRDGLLRPALGETWAAVADTRVFLTYNAEQMQRRAVLTRGGGAAFGTVVEFDLV